MKKIQMVFNQLQSSVKYDVTVHALIEATKYTKLVKLVVCKEDRKKKCYVSLIEKGVKTDTEKTFLQMFVSNSVDSKDYEFTPNSKGIASMRTQPLGGPVISLEEFVSVIALELASQLTLKE